VTLVLVSCDQSGGGASALAALVALAVLLLFLYRRRRHRHPQPKLTDRESLPVPNEFSPSVCGGGSPASVMDSKATPGALVSDSSPAHPRPPPGVPSSRRLYAPLAVARPGRRTGVGAGASAEGGGVELTQVQGQAFVSNPLARLTAGPVPPPPAASTGEDAQCVQCAVLSSDAGWC
jgi:MYXO-CTERM domain-containing protein